MGYYECTGGGNVEKPLYMFVYRQLEGGREISGSHKLEGKGKIKMKIYAQVMVHPGGSSQYSNKFITIYNSTTSVYYVNRTEGSSASLTEICINGLEVYANSGDTINFRIGYSGGGYADWSKYKGICLAYFNV